VNYVIKVLSLFYFLTCLYLFIILAKRLKGGSSVLRYLFFNTISSLIVILVTAIFRFHSVSNVSIFCYTMFEFLFLSLILDQFMSVKQQFISKSIRYSYFVIILLYLFCSGQIMDDNLWVSFFPSAVLIIFSLSVINKILGVRNIQRESIFSLFIVCAIFLLHLFSLPIDVYDYFVFNYLHEDSNKITIASHMSIYVMFNLFTIFSIKKFC